LVSEDEVRSRWAEFTSEVSRRKISIGSALGGTTLLGVTNGVIRVECENDFQVTTLQMNREVLTEIIHSVFSARGSIQGELHAGSAGPGTPVKEDHPLVQTLKRELGAEPM
jgi:acetylornithine deacetylase/succinyl-diaminopimelate desuccinylase-like protein